MRRNKPWFGPIPSIGKAIIPVSWEGYVVTVAFVLGMGLLTLEGDLTRRSGDDFAARVYVFFDVPTRQLSFGQRMTLSLARRLTGENLPAAAICYVWDNHHAPGTIAPNPFYAPVRTVVIESGNGKTGQWVGESRDLAADFRKAFGREAPPLTGIAIAADTDNTRAQANAWFGDMRLAVKPSP